MIYLAMWIIVPNQPTGGTWPALTGARRVHTLSRRGRTTRRGTHETLQNVKR